MNISRKKRVLWVGLAVTMGLLLSFAVVYAAISITYEHWADGETPPKWQANILSVGKADYAEGEVIPHFFQADKLVTGTVYYLDIETDFYQPSSNACGFWQFNTWDLDRPNIPLNGFYTDTNDFDKPYFAGDIGDGQLWVANVDGIEVKGPYFNALNKQKFVRVIYTPTIYTDPVEFYWGLQIGLSGDCDGITTIPITGSVGATAWTGGSLQTTIVCNTPVPPGYATVDCQGSGSLQADPSGIKPTAITGYKWFDKNGNGIWDALPPAITCVDPPAVGCEYVQSDWEIQAFLCNNLACDDWGPTVVVSDTTNDQGKYTLSDLTVGSTYRVCEVIEQNNPPAYWRQTFPDPNVDLGCSSPITITASGGGVLVTRQDFGNWLGTTAVTLSDFKADPDNDNKVALLVEWKTAMQTDTLGFNLYRSRDEDGSKRKLLAYLDLEFDGEYEYLDKQVGRGKPYYYWLEAFYIGGSTGEFGPIEGTVPKRSK